MTPARRVFVLLGTYEELTERESSALRRGDFDHAVTLETRKGRLAEAMVQARRNVELSSVDASAFISRVRCLETREKENLELLREGMTRVRAALGQLSQATNRTRRVRRGYAGNPTGGALLAESVLGRA